MTRLTYTIEELQEALQEKSPRTAIALIRKLETRHGFPRRLPARRPKWSKPAVDRWFETWDAPPAVQFRADPDDDLRRIARDMEKTYA